MLNENVKESYYNRKLWIDPYDSETINNKYIRALIRRASLFFPNVFYSTRILKNHYWPENLVLLGTAALNENNKDLVKEITNDLINHENRQLFWGLPINWHSGKYLFPKNTLMSTTTAETILFLYEVNNEYENVEKEILINSAYNLVNKLNKSYITEKNYLFSYTPLDSYRVYNSNLLVAAAIAVVGQRYEDKQLLKIGEDILNTCISYIPSKGYIPYHFGGTEDTSDSYHQLFSIRALWYLTTVFPQASQLYKITLEYFWGYFYSKETGSIKLRPNKNIWDLQPYAEALRVLGLIKDLEGYNKLLNSLEIFKGKNDEYVQRIWPLGDNYHIKSNVCYSRQGLFRLYAGLSFKRSVIKNDI
jgi:hypothetical protein